MTDTTHKAPERIFATGMDRDPTGRWWHDKPLTGAIEYVRADLIAAHVAAALREAAKDVRQWGTLFCGSEDVTDDVVNDILALIPDGGAALDRVVAAERERCAKVAEEWGDKATERADVTKGLGNYDASERHQNQAGAAVAIAAAIRNGEGR